MSNGENDNEARQHKIEGHIVDAHSSALKQESSSKEDEATVEYFLPENYKEHGYKVRESKITPCYNSKCLSA